MHQLGTGTGCRKEKEKRKLSFCVPDWRQPCCLCKSNRKKKKKDQNFKVINVYKICNNTKINN